jgi:hypothetical protein
VNGYPREPSGIRIENGGLDPIDKMKFTLDDGSVVPRRLPKVWSERMSMKFTLA